MLKASITQIDTIKTYSVINAGLVIFANHHSLFNKLILDRAKDLFENFMILVVHKNRDVKENSMDAFQGIITEIANGLTSQHN